MEKNGGGGVGWRVVGREGGVGWRVVGREGVLVGEW